MPTVKRQYFNDLAARWDDLSSMPGCAATVSRFVERAEMPAAGRILDAGCGTGLLLPDIRRIHGASVAIIEMDLADEMLRRNRERHRAGRAWHLCGDLAALPLAPGGVDVVLCFGVIPHVMPLEPVLGELRRVLRPGGVAAVGHAMNSADLNAFHSTLSPAVASDYLVPAPELAELMRKTGFEGAIGEESDGWYFVRAEAPGA